MRIDVTKPVLPALEEYVEQLKDIWDVKWLTNNGPKLKELEAAITQKFELDELVLCSNGTVALTLALLALDKKGEVITTPFTFAATATAIEAAGCTPVFADIDPDRLTLDPASVEELVTENTVAIMPVQVYGVLSDHERLSSLAKKYELPLIYDAAHCFAASTNGISALNLGDMACFSLHATKLFHTVEGGGIVCHDPKTKEKLKRLTNFGISSPDSINLSGMNGKMSEFHAAMGLALLPYLDGIVDARKQVYDAFEERLKRVEGVRFLTEHFVDQHNYAYCPIIMEGGEPAVLDVLEKLQKYDIHPRRYFYPSLSEVEAFSQCKSNSPISESVSKSALCLPIFPELELSVIEKVCEVIGLVAAQNNAQKALK